MIIITTKKGLEERAYRMIEELPPQRLLKMAEFSLKGWGRKRHKTPFFDYVTPIASYLVQKESSGENKEEPEIILDVCEVSKPLDDILFIASSNHEEELLEKSVGKLNGSYSTQNQRQMIIYCPTDEEGIYYSFCREVEYWNGIQFFNYNFRIYDSQRSGTKTEKTLIEKIVTESIKEALHDGFFFRLSEFSTGCAHAKIILLVEHTRSEQNPHHKRIIESMDRWAEERLYGIREKVYVER